MQHHQENLYLFKKVEAVKGQGMLVSYDGALYPARGFPTQEVFAATYFIKRTIRESLKFPLLFLYSKKKLIRSFNLIGFISLENAIHPNYIFCPAAEKIRLMVKTFLKEIGIPEKDANFFAKYIACIFEHDNAYRYRVQDLATESNELDLLNNPSREIKRLLGIFLERDDNPVVREKFNRFVFFIKIALFFPKYKKAFKKAVLLGLDGLKYDRQDWYWVCQRTDYLYGGLTKEERLKEFDIYPKLYTLEELKAMVQ